MSKYIGNRYVPLHCGKWDINKSYESLSVVLADDGNSYTSIKNVPSQIPLDNTNYWVISSIFNEQLNTLNNLINQIYDNLNEKVNKTRGLFQNEKTSNKSLLELFSYAGQGTLDNIITSIIHHYNDSDVMQLDNVGTGNVIFRLKNAHNNLHRPDKDDNFVGDGIFLECAYHNLELNREITIFRINPDGSFSWTDFAKTAILKHNKIDDGNFAFDIQCINSHENFIRFLNGNTTLLEFLNSNNKLMAHIRSGSNQTQGLHIQARKGNLNLSSEGNININQNGVSSKLLTSEKGAIFPTENLFDGKFFKNTTTGKYYLYNGDSLKWEIINTTPVD